MGHWYRSGRVRDFIVWAARRGRPLLVPHRLKSDPVGIDDDSPRELLQQCLTDTDLPLNVRAAGSVLLLFGQHLARVTVLPTTALSTADGHTVLVLDHTPIRLPEKILASLLAELAGQPPPPAEPRTHPTHGSNRRSRVSPRPASTAAKCC